MRLLTTIFLFAVQVAAQSSLDIGAVQKAAEDGDTNAQVRLAEAYEDGEGVPKNDVTSVEWLRRAAEAGNAGAMNSIGVAFRQGRGVRKDFAEAVNWYRRAALTGNGNAFYNLGTAYYNGEGVPYDRQEALIWFILAMNARIAEAEQAVEMIKKDIGPRRTTYALEKLASMYETGDQVPRNQTAARDVYLSQSHDPRFQMKLAEIYRDGRGVPRDLEETLRWCRRAADLNYPPGFHCIADAYRAGTAVRKDPKEALKWYEGACARGLTQALEPMADIYLSGELGKRDEVRGLMIYLVGRDLFKMDVLGQKAERLASQMTAKEVKAAFRRADTWVAEHRRRVAFYSRR